MPVKDDCWLFPHWISNLKGFSRCPITINQRRVGSLKQSSVFWNQQKETQNNTFTQRQTRTQKQQYSANDTVLKLTGNLHLAITVSFVTFHLSPSIVAQPALLPIWPFPHLSFFIFFKWLTSTFLHLRHSFSPPVLVFSFLRTPRIIYLSSCLFLRQHLQHSLVY